MPEKEKNATDLIKELKADGDLKTENLELDDDQDDPTVEAGSSEERELLGKMEALLTDEAKLRCSHLGSDAKAKEYKLMCLRGRKYDAERAAQLLPQFLDLIEEFGLKPEAPTEQLCTDAATGKVVVTGGADAKGRPVMRLMLRYHNPKESKAPDMAKLITTVILHLLRGSTAAQRCGIVLLNDMTGLSLKNLDPAVPKLMFGSVFPRLPVRVARICIFDPPFIIGRVIFPVFLMLMSKKLRARITLIKERDFKALHAVYPPTMLTEELGGTLKFDKEKWIKELVSGV